MLDFEYCWTTSNRESYLGLDTELFFLLNPMKLIRILGQVSSQFLKILEFVFTHN